MIEQSKNFVKQNSNEFMQIYIQDVFNIVMEIYKDIAPELIASSLQMDKEKVQELDSNEIKKKLNNLNINYEVVNQKEEEKIWYHDTIKQKMISQLTGRNIHEEPDELLLHLHEPEVLEKSSVEDIKKMRTNNGMSKIISDINYISHEMAHAFEHIITAQNPSYTDSMAILFTKSQKDMINYDIGESFAVSMERLVLDKLKQDGELEKYNLTQYATLEDIEDVWNKKRIDPYSRKENVGVDSDGKTITYLDLDLIPYQIIKNEGMESMVEYIKNVNLVNVYNGIPNKNDSTEITRFCDQITEEKYRDCKIPEINEYKTIFSKEQILMMIKQISLFQSAIEATEISTRTEMMNDQVISIRKEVEQEKIRKNNLDENR